MMTMVTLVEGLLNMKEEHEGVFWMAGKILYLYFSGDYINVYIYIH